MKDKKILITGSNGFIGKNLTANLIQKGYTNLYLFDRNSSSEDLDNFCKNADFVFHLAGVNRPLNNQEFYDGNTDFSKTLIETLKKHNNKAPIIISSSIQAEMDNDYGKSKKLGEDLFLENNENPSFIFRLYGVFGKWSKPNYNTVVATFMHNIINDIEVKISDETHLLKLCYIDDVVDKFIAILENTNNYKAGFLELDTHHNITLGSLYNIILQFKKSRENLVMPSLDSLLMKRLYGTFLSFLPKDGFSYHLKKNTDDRGWLSEFIKSENFGQIFISTTKPGITRGNHWHNTKVEKFFVIKGTGEIAFRNVLDDEILYYTVKGENPEVIDIPVGYTHYIKNIGDDELICLFWSSEIFNPEKPDTYYLEI